MDSEQKKTRLLPVLVVKEELVVGLIVDQQKHGRKPRKRGHRDFFSYEIDSLIAGAARQASDQKRKSILYQRAKLYEKVAQTRLFSLLFDVKLHR